MGRNILIYFIMYNKIRGQKYCSLYHVPVYYTNTSNTILNTASFPDLFLPMLILIGPSNGYWNFPIAVWLAIPACLILNSPR